ncbi:LuxR C-terminal-related transcriptional regulator [Planobispora siamensis]|uniref:Helix-turn-helix transcriptional regulator n=1 Tax=Planobispora siamensis TaxID=936338 RepID=A0A8J3SNU2_9ACTN|nr:LuxR C-terminal-related transcriptional regulator [Planobispora siamensis]GIH95724.1 helix-turn-helix transcriptional regulator [Planobispora siamensis]
MRRWFRETERKKQDSHGIDRLSSSSLTSFADIRTHPPSHRPEWIHRPALIRTLNGARSARLVLVSAPAGFGKSALVAEWRASADQDRPFAWVTLDRSANAAGVLWRAVETAIRGAIPELDGDWPEISLPDQSQDHAQEQAQDQASDADELLLLRLLGVLAARRRPCVLVLDDFHTLHDPLRHRQVETFADHLPAGVQLVIVTRAEPALPLARYRTVNDIVELRTDDLRFTKEEAARLVHRLAGVRLHGSVLDGLLDSTEGWPAALHMAALSLRTATDPAAFVADFTGTYRTVADYLDEEVIGSLSAELRRFLLCVSVLDRFTAALCDAVAGTSDAAGLLQELERTNTFLVPLDGHRYEYRLHRLFRQALLGELTRAEPELAATLHRRASDWYGERKRARDAIEHALAGEDGERALRLFQAHWAEYVNAGHLAIVQGWMRSIGTARAGGDPVTAVCAAWISALSGDRLATRHWLHVAESLPHRGPLPDGSPSVRFSVCLVHALFGFDGVPSMLGAAREAVALEPDPTAQWHSAARTALGYGLYLNGDGEAALRPLEQAAQNTAAWPIFRILALAVLSLTLGGLGRFAEAEEPARVAYDLAEAWQLTESPTTSPAADALGAVLAREGRPLEARRLLERALDVRRRVVGLTPWPTLGLLIRLAGVASGSGDRTAARGFVDQAEHLLTAEPDSGEHLRAEVSRIRHATDAVRPAVPLGPLTPRELAVLRLLQGDLSVREIGQELFLSANTVKTHTRSIYRKLGVTSRHDAVHHARRLGLL